MSNKARLKEVFTRIIENNCVDEVAIYQYFSKDYVQKVDGRTLTFDDLIQHMYAQKSRIHDCQTQFLTMIEEDNIVFSHHIVHAKKANDDTIEVEVFAQFEFNGNGKICACNELTRLIKGDSPDADIGSAT